ncbi:MAG: hypothetical protein Q9182_002130 [Xanthomendoza sp. 2 TL-2023]
MGANTGARNADQKTPLILAAEYGKPEVVQMLLEQGADVRIKDNQSKSALDHAKDHEAARILLQQYALPTLYNLPSSLAQGQMQAQQDDVLVEQGDAITLSRDLGTRSLN